MTLSDYLERITAKVRKDLDKPRSSDINAELGLFKTNDHVMEMFTSAHLFNLGEADDIERGAADIEADLDQDLKERVPAPFENMIVMFSRNGEWSMEWHVRVQEYARDLPTLSKANDLRFLVDFTEGVEGRSVFDHILVYDLIRNPGQYPIVQIYGTAIRRFQRASGLSDEMAGKQLTAGLITALKRLALISHPANYYVRRSPKYTPREERRSRERGDRPVRKRPHYIVIDHDALKELNPATRSAGGGTPKAPHARRGHWRKLGERCKAAREAGKTRTFVRESYIGEREFEDEKNRYVVLLDQKSLIESGKTDTEG